MISLTVQYANDVNALYDENTWNTDEGDYISPEEMQLFRTFVRNAIEIASLHNLCSGYSL